MTRYHSTQGYEKWQKPFCICKLQSQKYVVNFEVCVNQSFCNCAGTAHILIRIWTWMTQKPMFYCIREILKLNVLATVEFPCPKVSERIATENEIPNRRKCSDTNNFVDNNFYRKDMLQAICWSQL